MARRRGEWEWSPATSECNQQNPMSQPSSEFIGKENRRVGAEMLRRLRKDDA